MSAFPNDQAPALVLPTVNGGEVFDLAATAANGSAFTVVIFYRGKHCPICQMQFQDAEKHYQQLKDAKMQVVGISMDPEDKAEAFSKSVAESLGQDQLQTKIAYGLTEAQAREWGLYISEARVNSNEPAVFSEPGMYVIKPDNTVFMAQVQSAPFTRPSMDQLIGGLSWAHEHKYPTRGTVKK